MMGVTLGLAVLVSAFGAVADNAAKPVAADKAAKIEKAARERAAKVSAPARAHKMVPGIVKIPYGKTPDGKETTLYRVMGAGGIVVDFVDYGARVVRIYTPDAKGDLADICVGWNSAVEEYILRLADLIREHKKE